MALIRLEEAIDLGLVPQEAASRFPAVARSRLFGSPILFQPGRFGAQPTYLNRPGISPFRFGLGPLALGLALSPPGSAFRGTPPPVGRAPVRRPTPPEPTELNPQDAKTLLELIEAGALPPQALPTARQALAQRRAPSATGGSRVNLGGPRPPAPPSALAQVFSRGRQAVSAARQARSLAELLREPSHARPSGSEAAFQAQRAGERAPFELLDAGSLAEEVGTGRASPSDIFDPNWIGGSDPLALLAAAASRTRQEAGPRAFGAQIAGEGGAEGLRTLGTTLPEVIDPSLVSGFELGATGADFAPTTVGGLGSLPGIRQIGDLLRNPLLQGVSQLGQVAGPIISAAQGNRIGAAGSALAMFLPFPFNIGAAVAASLLGSFFKRDKQAISQAHERRVLQRDLAVAIPQSLGGQRAAFELGDLIGLSYGEALPRLRELEHRTRTGVGTAPVFSRAGGPQRDQNAMDNWIGFIRSNDALARLRGTPLSIDRGGGQWDLGTILWQVRQFADIPPDAFEVDARGNLVAKGTWANQWPTGRWEQGLREIFGRINPKWEESMLGRRFADLPSLDIPADAVPSAATTPPPPPPPDSIAPPTPAEPPNIGSFRHGGVVPESGPYRLEEGELMLPAGRSGIGFRPFHPFRPFGPSLPAGTLEGTLKGYMSLPFGLNEAGPLEPLSIPYRFEDETLLPPGPPRPVHLFRSAGAPLPEGVIKGRLGGFIGRGPSQTSSSGFGSAGSFRHGGVVPRAGVYQLEGGEIILPAADADRDDTGEHWYLPIEGGSPVRARRNPDSSKFWRIATQPAEARGALRSGTPAEIPILLSEEAVGLGPGRLRAVAEAARRVQHGRLDRAFGDFIEARLASAPMLDLAAAEQLNTLAESAIPGITQIGRMPPEFANDPAFHRQLGEENVRAALRMLEAEGMRPSPPQKAGLASLFRFLGATGTAPTRARVPESVQAP